METYHHLIHRQKLLAVATLKIHSVIIFVLGTVKKKDDAAKRLCTQI